MIPSAGLPKKAAFLAILSVVPSPPIAIAQSQIDIALSNVSNFAFVFANTASCSSDKYTSAPPLISLLTTFTARTLTPLLLRFEKTEIIIIIPHVIYKLIVLRQHFHKQQAHLILIDKSNIQYYPQAL